MSIKCVKCPSTVSSNNVTRIVNLNVINGSLSYQSMNEYNTNCCEYVDIVGLTVVAGANTALLYSNDSPCYSRACSSSYCVKFRIIILIVFYFNIGLFI